MASNKITGLPIIEESEANGEIARIYDEIKRELQLPAVPNSILSIAPSEGMLKLFWTMYKTFLDTTSFPQSLVSMILYTIAKTNECQYCSATHELTCRQLGIDEETLKSLITELDQISPERLRATINFTLKVSDDPQSIGPEDYEALRAQGVGDDEIIELVFVAALGKFNDILADSFKIEIEPEVVSALRELPAS